jgi:NADPH:quinone reductase-like Zn-dependent oxidoreductase
VSLRGVLLRGSRLRNLTTPRAKLALLAEKALLLWLRVSCVWYGAADPPTRVPRDVAQMHEKQELTIPVGSILPLTDAIDAHEMLAGTRAHKRGKIVIEVAT